MASTGGQIMPPVMGAAAFLMADFLSMSYAKICIAAAIPAISIGIAATTVSGQNLGAQKMDRVFQTLKISIYYALAIAAVVTLLLFIFPYQIGAIFLKQSPDHARVLNFVHGYYLGMAFIFPWAVSILVACRGRRRPLSGRS